MGQALTDVHVSVIPVFLKSKTSKKKLHQHTIRLPNMCFRENTEDLLIHFVGEGCGSNHDEPYARKGVILENVGLLLRSVSQDVGQVIELKVPCKTSQYAVGQACKPEEFR